MSVKPEIFQETKQTILKNKYQFIEIQLKQVYKRIDGLKTQNMSLKSQIKSLKQANNKSRAQPSTHRDSDKEGNKQNKCTNKNRLIEVTSATHRGHATPVTVNLKSTLNKIQAVDTKTSQLEVKELQQKLMQEQKTKQRTLQSLQNQIKILKTLWQKQQTELNNKKNMQKQKFNKPINSRNIQVEPYQQNLIIQKDKSNINFPNANKPLKISIESLNESKIYGDQNNRISLEGSLNSSQLRDESWVGAMANSTSKGLIRSYNYQNRKKTMSVNLNIGSNQMVGFVFGKKSMQKPKIRQESISNKRWSQHVNKQDNYVNQKRISQASCSLANGYMNDGLARKKQLNQRPMNSLNNSLSHSNRTSMSNLNSSKSFVMRKSQASKSYAKIVTKLQCYGCKLQFRPNQYYSHIQDCRQFLKLKLMNEKQQIEDEINQTLNLSQMNY